MDKIIRFIECDMPYYYCNLKCDYCYVIQGGYREREHLKLDYSIERIRASTTKERFGGMCFFSLCASGETLAPKESVEIVRALLENGHFVNITNNGTITKRIHELCKLPSDLRKNLLLSFSLHYLELKRLNLLDVFFDNVNAVKEAGISFFVQINLYDGYIPYIDEIKQVCFERTGAYPQCPVARRNTDKGFALHTTLPDVDYLKIGNEFDSPLFNFTAKYFMKKQYGFCYAGDWSFVLNLRTGTLRKCYGFRKGQNIFQDPNKPIKFQAVGNNCPEYYCTNSSHFIAQGVIPMEATPSYAELRNRSAARWFNDTASSLLNDYLYKQHEEYGRLKKLCANVSTAAENWSIRSAASRLLPVRIKSLIKQVLSLSLSLSL